MGTVIILEETNRLSNLSSNMLKISKFENQEIITNKKEYRLDEQIRKAIECGTCKINVNTELQIAWRNGVINFINANPSVYDPRKLIGGGENLMRAAIREKVTLFGSGSRV